VEHVQDFQLKKTAEGERGDVAYVAPHAVRARRQDGGERLDADVAAALLHPGCRQEGRATSRITELSSCQSLGILKR